MNKMNPFPTLTAPFPLIFIPSLCITFEVVFEAKLLTNPSQISLAK